MSRLERRAQMFLIVILFVAGAASTILGAYEIHNGLGILVSGGWVVFCAVMAAISLEERLERERNP